VTIEITVTGPVTVNQFDPAAINAPVLAQLTRMENTMSAVDDALATIGTSVDELVKDVQRLIDSFTPGQLTAEQQTMVDGIVGKTDAIDAAVETVVPE